MKTSFKVLVFSLILSFATLLASNTFAQCSLCASSVAGSVHSNVEKAGLGLNKGIVMLLIMPYAVAGIVALLWYTNVRSNKREKINFTSSNK